jgi:hypothetical protein
VKEALRVQVPTRVLLVLLNSRKVVLRQPPDYAELALLIQKNEKAALEVPQLRQGEGKFAPPRVPSGSRDRVIRVLPLKPSAPLRVHRRADGPIGAYKRALLNRQRAAEDTTNEEE